MNNRPTPQPHILVVEDNAEIRDLVIKLLSREGFRVSPAADGKAMHRAMADGAFDLILLDLMLPGEDGLSLCRTLRASSQVPVIMLTAKGDEIDRVVGLELGADDYIAKPFSGRELVARIRAVLRRTRSPSASLAANPDDAADTAAGFRFDRWLLDTRKRELIRDGAIRVPLSTGEYDLLHVFVQRPQRVLNRDQLLDLARGRAAQMFDRSIDTQVSRLRKKLENDPTDPQIIKTIWGGGYMFAQDVETINMAQDAPT